MFNQIYVSLFALLGTAISVLILVGLGFLIAFRVLGIRRYYPKAEEPTLRRIRQAKGSYLWLGTSANYVIGNPAIEELIREHKHHVKIRFVTIHPECKTAMYEHAKWQNTAESALKERIEFTRKTIASLKRKGCNIEWLGHSQIPTFRVVVIDEKRVLVSFYQAKTRGPDSPQFEIAADSILGRWFMDFFDKNYLMAEMYMKDLKQEAEENSAPYGRRSS